MAHSHRLGVMAAALGCVALVGVALFPRNSRTAADIDDLRTGLNVYQGRLYSDTNDAIEAAPFEIQVTSKNGNKFEAESTIGPMTGSVGSSGKFKAEVEAVGGSTARGKSGALGGFTSMKFKGQLSATGEAVIGTYQGKGPTNDKGSCFFVVALAP